MTGGEKKTDLKIRKKTLGQPINRSVDDPYVRAARPPAEIMEIDLPGGGAVRKRGGGG